MLVPGRILHDWDLGRKRALLVYDTIIDDGRRTNAMGLLMSLKLRLETWGGFDYTGADCMGWIREAGFRAALAEPLTEKQSMVVGTR